MDTRTVHVSDEYAGTRLDVFLSRFYEGKFSRAKIQQAIKQGRVLVERAHKQPHYCVKAGDAVSIDEAFTVRTLDEAPRAQKIPLDILYEDEYLIAVNKPTGMVVHPGAGNTHDTLVNALSSYCQNLSGLSGPSRPGIVHRLDKDTSGVILVAKDDTTHRLLAEQFKERTVHKTYVAVVKGIIEQDEGIIEAPLSRKPGDRKKMQVSLSDAKAAVTKYKVVRRFSRKASLVEAYPVTGRTHQLRVHFRYLGHPIWGDRTYGGPVFSRLLLHALRIECAHPVTRKALRIEAPLPEEFAFLTRTFAQG